MPKTIPQNEDASLINSQPLVSVKISIPVEPVPKGRPRLGQAKIKGSAFRTRPVAFTPKATRIYESKLSHYINYKYSGPPLEGPLSLTVIFYVKKPKSTKRIYPEVRPDLDNYLKAVMDACNRKLYNDDGQIVTLSSSKFYGDKPRIEILLTKLI